MTAGPLAALGFAVFMLGAAVGLPASGAVAATFPEEASFDRAAFDAAQKAGKPILIHITAPWCTTCAAQKPILEKLRAEPRFRSLVVFNVDFDDQKVLVHRFEARAQSTLIVYKGKTEAGRSTGETRPDAIEALLAKAVS